MADRHGRVRLQQQMRDRLADDVTAAYDDRLGTLERDPVLGQERHDPERGRRHERRPPEVELAGVEGMETVYVLDRVDRADQPRLVEVRWKRKLNEDSVDCLVGVQLREERQQLSFRDIF